MKILRTFSGREYEVEDDEAKNIERIFKSNCLISLRTGEVVNTSAIEAIGDPELVPYWDGYMLDRNGSSFMRDGKRIFLETQDFKNIEYKPHPKYEAMRRMLIEKTKMLSDKQRTEVGEEIARKERE